MIQDVPRAGRRALFSLSGTAILGAFVWRLIGSDGTAVVAATPAPLKLSDEAWKKRLSPEAFAVLRQAGTEAPFTSPLNEEHRKGLFVCAGCALPLFSSRTKFDSGTGWPSFYDHLADAVGEHRDLSLGIPRVEVHCARCAGHLGHAFEDGPKPTGLRYCMNGIAMHFKTT